MITILSLSAMDKPINYRVHDDLATHHETMSVAEYLIAGDERIT